MTRIIETDRLILRPFQPDDLPHIQRYAIRPEFYRFLFIPEQTLKTIAAFLEAKLSRQAADRPVKNEFAVEFKDVGHIVGTIKLGGVDAAHGSGELGYALDNDFQGQGLMTEAVHAIMDYGFTALDLHRIWAIADVKNTASWHLLERVGMQREGVLRQNKNIRGNWRDSYLYAVLEPKYQHRDRETMSSD